MLIYDTNQCLTPFFDGKEGPFLENVKISHIEGTRNLILGSLRGVTRMVSGADAIWRKKKPKCHRCLNNLKAIIRSILMWMSGMWWKIHFINNYRNRWLSTVAHMGYSKCGPIGSPVNENKSDPWENTWLGAYEVFNVRRYYDHYRNNFFKLNNKWM